MRRVVVVLVISLSAAGADAKNEYAIRKGEGGYLSTPCDFIPDSAEITDGPEGLRLNGVAIPDPTTVPPCFDYFVVRGVKPPKAPGGPGEVEVRYGGLPSKRLLFRTASPLAAFERLFVSEDEKLRIEKVYLDRTRAELRRKTRAAFFSDGPLATLSDSAKDALTNLAVIEHDKVRLRYRVDEFKGLRYFVANLGPDDSVYNEEKLTQAQRLALLLNKKLLAHLRDFEQITRGSDGLEGIKLELAIPHKSFIAEGDSTEYDILELYAPMATLRQFIAADLTARKFLDNCVILINKNRTEVPAEL